MMYVFFIDIASYFIGNKNDNFPPSLSLSLSLSPSWLRQQGTHLVAQGTGSDCLNLFNLKGSDNQISPKGPTSRTDAGCEVNCMLVTLDLSVAAVQSMNMHIHVYIRISTDHIAFNMFLTNIRCHLRMQVPCSSRRITSTLVSIMGRRSSSDQIQIA